MTEESEDDALEEDPEELLEDDEISPREEAFMAGYQKEGNHEQTADLEEDEIDKEFE